MSFIIIFAAAIFGTFMIYRHRWNSIISAALGDIDEGTEELRRAAAEALRALVTGMALFVSKAVLFLIGIGTALVAALMFHGVVPVGSALIVIATGILAMWFVHRNRPRSTEGAPDAEEDELPVWKRVYRRIMAPADRQSPFETSVGMLFLFGFSTFFLSQYCENQYLAVIGTVYDILAGYVAFLLLWPLARLLVAGIDFAEFASDKIIDIAQSLHVSFKALKREPTAAHINIADQEVIMPGLRQALLSYLAVFAAIHVFGIHFPGLKTLFVVSCLIGLTIFIAWKNLQAAKIDISDRLIRSALVFEIVAYALVAYTVINILRPEFFKGVWTWIESVKSGQRALTFVDWLSGIVGLGIGIAGAVMIGRFWNPSVPFVTKTDGTVARGLPVMRTIRNSIVLGFIALAIFCGTGLAVAGLSRGTADTISANGMSASAMLQPSVDVADESGAPLLKFTWKEVPGVKGYRIEWRKPDETMFKPLTDVSAGVSHFEKSGQLDAKDANSGIVQGKTLFFRMVALNHDGKDSKPSPEVRVEISKPKPIASATASVKTSLATVGTPAQKAPLPAKCTGSGCALPVEYIAMCKQLDIPCD